MQYSPSIHPIDSPPFPSTHGKLLSRLCFPSWKCIQVPRKAHVLWGCSVLLRCLGWDSAEKHWKAQFSELEPWKLVPPPAGLPGTPGTLGAYGQQPSRLRYGSASLPAFRTPLPSPSSSCASCASAKLYIMAAISPTTKPLFDYPCPNLLRSSWNWFSANGFLFILHTNEELRNAAAH